MPVKYAHGYKQNISTLIQQASFCTRSGTPSKRFWENSKVVVRMTFAMYSYIVLSTINYLIKVDNETAGFGYDIDTNMQSQ